MVSLPFRRASKVEANSSAPAPYYKYDRGEEAEQEQNQDPNAPPSPNNRRQSKAQDVSDPILSAIHDAQPFEQSYNHQGVHQSLSPDMQLRDTFGAPISDPDRSNPTRPRNERPLDTIRTFEYLTTGDERVREEMETGSLGFVPRQGFTVPQFDTNPYAPQESSSNGPEGGNVISFAGNGESAEFNYIRDPPTMTKEKKKRGLFGRKKKEKPISVGQLEE